MSDMIQFQYRKGTVYDPYISITETLTIHNGMILLKEIPVEFDRVTITNYFETRNPEISTPNLFYVDYTLGFIYFHSQKNGSQVAVNYKGRGIVKFPSSRVMLQDNSNNWTSTNLEDLAKEIKSQVNNLYSITNSLKGYGN